MDRLARAACRDFLSPLFTGCENDTKDYARASHQKLRGTRFWVPLIGLRQGLRWNEICQSDTTDIRISSITLNGQQASRVPRFSCGLFRPDFAALILRAFCATR